MSVIYKNSYTNLMDLTLLVNQSLVLLTNADHAAHKEKKDKEHNNFGI